MGRQWEGRDEGIAGEGAGLLEKEGGDLQPPFLAAPCSAPRHVGRPLGKHAKTSSIPDLRNMGASLTWSQSNPTCYTLRGRVSCNALSVSWTRNP